MFLLVYNMLRRVMLIAARSLRVKVDRMSFANTLAWLRFGDITRGVPVAWSRVSENVPKNSSRT
jgi:hypothetical protein